jgi:hypothetical protein
MSVKTAWHALLGHQQSTGGQAEATTSPSMGLSLLAISSLQPIATASMIV